ncbi:MAG: thioredoxin family protein [Spirulinaceae cyanobacterium SM2_1_0]|nr:thioredoxin family protein [Spirulinaceae cyanobacterium SM2_1_0]
MARTASTMLDLGTAAPAFQLPDVVTRQFVSLASFDNCTALLVMFICAHCPFVKHVEQELARLGQDYQDRNLGIVAISANDVSTHPDDAPDKLAVMAKQLGFTFPLCYDETQEVAKAYTAACTPDFFLFDRDRHLIYRGQLDDSRPGNDQPVNGKDLRAAINAALAGEVIPSDQKPSIGCNIKWKVGNEPPYYG